MCKIMKVRVSSIGIVEERRKEEDPKGPNSNTLYVHTQYWNMQYWIVFFASGVEAHRLTVVVLGVWSCTASAPQACCSTSLAKCAPFICAVHSVPSVHLLYVKFAERESSCCPVSSAETDWTVVLCINWYSTVFTALCNAKADRFVHCHAPPPHCVNVLWGLCWLLWFCVHWYCTAFCIVQWWLLSVCCALRTHMLTLVVLCGGEKVGEEGRWRRTPPLWFTTQLFYFAFLHFFICISCCCTFQNGRGAVHRPSDSQHNTNGKLNINAKQNTDTKHENTPKTQHIHKS